MVIPRVRTRSTYPTYPSNRRFRVCLSASLPMPNGCSLRPCPPTGCRLSPNEVARTTEIIAGTVEPLNGQRLGPTINHDFLDHRFTMVKRVSQLSGYPKCCWWTCSLFFGQSLLWWLLTTETPWQLSCPCTSGKFENSELPLRRSMYWDSCRYLFSQTRHTRSNHQSWLIQGGPAWHWPSDLISSSDNGWSYKVLYVTEERFKALHWKCRTFLDVPRFDKDVIKRVTRQSESTVKMLRWIGLH